MDMIQRLITAYYLLGSLSASFAQAIKDTVPPQEAEQAAGDARWIYAGVLIGLVFAIIMRIRRKSEKH